MPSLNDNTLDNGLAALKAAADRIYINSSEPATYTAATSTVALGNKTLAAGGIYSGAITAGTPSGRYLDSIAVTDGSVTTGGTASHSSVVSSAASRLEVAQALSATQVVSSGNIFTLTAQRVRLPNLGG